MDCNQQTFTISRQKHLAQNDRPKQTRINNSKPIFFFFLIIIIIITTSSMLLPSMNIKNQRPEQLKSSLSSTQARTRVDFLTSLQLATNELNNTLASITKALSSSISNRPLVGPRLSVCQKSVNDSLSRLNDSSGLLLGVDSDVEALTYEEMDNLGVWGKASMDDVEKCFLKLEEMDDMMVAMGGEDEKMMGVEEVKLGLVKAKKLIANSIWLFDRRESILDDLYSTFLEIDYDYSFDHNFLIGYKFLIGMYFLMYLVLAFLYFLMRSNK